MMKRENRAAIIIVAVAFVLITLTTLVGTQKIDLTPESPVGTAVIDLDDIAEIEAMVTPPANTPPPAGAESPPAGAGAPSAGAPPLAGGGPPSPGGGSQSTGAAPQSAAPPQTPDPPSEAARAVEEALNALSPEQGIKSLNQALAGMPSAAEASRLYATRGRLLMHQAQPNFGNALADVAEAKRLAQDPYDAHYAARAEAELLLSQKESARASACIQQALTQYPSPTLPGLELRIMLAGIRENDGETDAAETAYLQTMEDSLAAVDALGPKALDQYRLAALKLARLYRKLGRAKEADALAQTVKQRLAQ